MNNSSMTFDGKLLVIYAVQSEIATGFVHSWNLNKTKFLSNYKH